MLTHACGFTASVLCLANIPLARDPSTPLWSSAPDKRGVPGQAVLSLVLMGVMGVGILAGGQALFQTERNQVTVLPVTTNQVHQVAAGRTNSGASATSQNLKPASNPLTNSPNMLRAAPGLLSLYNGQFILQVDQLPMIGSPAASNLIVYLFDYTCPHCRDLHAILAEAHSRLSNQLGIVSLPMPMSTNCNRFIPTDFSSSSNACDYARLGLALWRTAPNAYRQFDDWFFAQKQPPTLAEAMEFAEKLVPKEKLQAAQTDPWIDQQIETDCRLHFSNWNASGRPTMPQLVMGQAISVGPLVSVDHLLVLLNRYLGLEAPPR